MLGGEKPKGEVVTLLDEGQLFGHMGEIMVQPKYYFFWILVSQDML